MGESDINQCGAVTFVQRFGDALNLNVHFHSLVLDGVYACTEAGGPRRFHVLAPPSNAEVARVAWQVARRITRLLARRGLGGDSGPDLDRAWGTSLTSKTSPSSPALAVRVSPD